MLIVTRGFRSMLLSSYSQFVRSGGDLELPALVAVALEHRDPVLDALLTIEHWNYDRLVGRYREAFGAERVVVMSYELLRGDPLAFARALEARLGLDPGPVERERVNASLSGEEMAWYPRLARLARKVPSSRAYRLYVAAAFTNRLRVPIRVLQRLSPAPPITDSAIPDELMEPFRGLANSLRGDPFYAPYAAEYLW